MKMKVWIALAVSAPLACSVLPITSAVAQDVPKCEPQNVAKKYPSLVGKTVKIGADPQTPPYVYRDAKDFDKVIGFDADLARAVLDCGGIKYEFFLGGWSGLLPAVMAGQIDIMWDALYYTSERAKKLDFIVYQDAATGALTTPSNPKNLKSMDDLCGRAAASLLGTVEEAALREQDKKCKESGKAEITVMTAADNASLARLLENERIDLILNDLGLSLGMASNEPTKFRLAFKRLSGFTMAAALTKAKNDDLARAIYDGLRSVQANGTQKSIYDRYKMDPSLQKSPEILKK